jgi:hydroxymethylglutaryl-CoA reductase (NADPH)
MSIIPSPIVKMLEALRAVHTPEALRQRMEQAQDGSDSPALRAGRPNREGLLHLWKQLGKLGISTERSQSVLSDNAALDSASLYASNIENMIGVAKLPIGIAGPLKVNGLYASGVYHVPLATTEAALVASYSRGAELVTRAGGVTAAMLKDGVMRTPGFKMRSLLDAGLFVEWVVNNIDRLKAAAEATTRHGKLVALEPILDSDIVFLVCRYTTGDASGQNMVTIATEALCQTIIAECPLQPLHWFIEANFSGDKKSSYLGLLTGRGRKVSASVVLPAALVKKYLHVDVDRMMAYAEMANLGALLSGQLGAQGHYANGLAAFYIATGQDAACVSESAVGFTRMLKKGDDLFVSVTLPNILVGSVGGGTGLPTQSAALEMMGLRGEGKAAALAEVTAALCLCGEISIIGAIAAGHFVRAHRKLARERA